jgi:hypothetical protein
MRGANAFVGRLVDKTGAFDGHGDELLRCVRLHNVYLSTAAATSRDGCVWFRQGQARVDTFCMEGACTHFARRCAVRSPTLPPLHSRSATWPQHETPPPDPPRFTSLAGRMVGRAFQRRPAPCPPSLPSPPLSSSCGSPPHPAPASYNNPFLLFLPRIESPQQSRRPARPRPTNSLFDASMRHQQRQPPLGVVSMLGREQRTGVDSAIVVPDD